MDAVVLEVEVEWSSHDLHIGSCGKDDTMVAQIAIWMGDCCWASVSVPASASASASASALIVCDCDCDCNVREEAIDFCI